MKTKITTAIGICILLVAGFWRLTAQESPVVRPSLAPRPSPVTSRQFFGAVSYVPALEQSWDGRFLHVPSHEYYAPPDEYPDAPMANWNLHSLPDTYCDVATRQKLPSSEQPVGFTRHNKVLEQDRADFLCVRDIQTEKCTRLENEKGIVSWPTLHWFSPDGRHIIIEKDGVLSTWDTDSGQLLKRVRYAPQAVSVDTSSGYEVGPTLSPDHKLLAAIDSRDYSDGDPGFRVQLINAQSGKAYHVLPRREYQMIRFSPDNRILQTLAQRNFRDGKNLSKSDKRYNWLVQDLQFWDALTGKLLWGWEDQGMADLGHIGEFTPDGQMYGKPREREKDFALFDARTGKLIRALPYPISEWKTWTFSFDAKEIWSADDKGKIWLWPGI